MHSADAFSLIYVRRDCSVSMLTVVFESESFVVSPCRDCDVPGYLVLIARQEVETLSTLTSSTQELLGPTLARIELAIRQVTGAAHVYVLRFSEGLSAVHFHLFPRTDRVGSQWLAAAKPSDGELNGPYIFAWARIKFHVDDPAKLSSETLNSALQIKNALTR